jgi:hypothetical protein
MLQLRLQRTRIHIYTILSLVLFSILLTNTTKADETVFEISGGTPQDITFRKSESLYHSVRRPAIKFVAQSDLYICSATFKLHKTGTPNNTLNASLWEEDDFTTSSVETGTLLTTSANINGASLSESYEDTTFIFPNCQILGASGVYSIVINAQVNDPNYYIQGRNSSEYTWTQAWTDQTQGTWAENTNTEFYIRTNGIASSNLSAFNWTGTGSYGFTDQNFGSLGNMLMDVLKYLFVPNPNILQNFVDLWQDIRNKPPIGYLTVITDEFSNLTGGTASSSYNLTPYLSTIEPIVSPFRTGIVWLLWLSMGFWIFHRIRKLNL